MSKRRLNILSLTEEEGKHVATVSHIPDIIYLELKDGSYYGTDIFGLQHSLLKKSDTPGAFGNKEIEIPTITGMKTIKSYWWDSSLPKEIYPNTMQCKLVCERTNREVSVTVDSSLMFEDVELLPRKSKFLSGLNDNDYYELFNIFKKEVL